MLFGTVEASSAGERSVTPIEVIKGRASFDLPSGSQGSKTLVIVSALAREAGPFAVRLTASPRAAGAVRPFPIAADPPGPLIAGKSAQPVDRTPASASVSPATRQFFLLVRDGDAASASNYLPVKGRLVGVGRHVQVYVDERDTDALAPEMVAEVVSTFDTSVFPLAERRFGAAEDVDGNGRFTILVSSWLTRLAGGRLKVDGFVRGADFDLGLAGPFSNRCDMMYLSTSLTPGPHLRTVLAHEYTHAVTFSRKAFPADHEGHLKPEEEGWLDEGLAHLVEDLHGFSRSNLDYRVSAFLSRPERYRLVVEDYYAADLFRSHGNRGGAYLFLRWCVDRQGYDLLDRLIRSDLRGIANLEAATGQSFAALYREWTTALYLSGLEPQQNRTDAGLYRSLNPRGSFADWVLAGPHASRVQVGGPADVWSASGTSTHFAVVESLDPGATHIEVNGPARADLQVTVVRLPDDLGGLELDVRPFRTGFGAAPSVQARVGATRGGAVRIDAIAWESLVPAADCRAAGFRRGAFGSSEIQARFSATAIASGSRLDWRTIPLEGVRAGDGPIVFKAVGTDSAGRSVSAWAEVDFRRDDVEPDGGD
jgi:hypothetical protein